jgi:hypothetical protein
MSNGLSLLTDKYFEQETASSVRESRLIVTTEKHCGIYEAHIRV